MLQLIYIYIPINSTIMFTNLFQEDGSHRFLQISHSMAMTEPVFRDIVLVFFASPASQWFPSHHL